MYGCPCTTSRGLRVRGGKHGRNCEYMTCEVPVTELDDDVVGFATSTLGMTFKKLGFKTVVFLDGKTKV